MKQLLYLRGDKHDGSGIIEKGDWEMRRITDLIGNTHVMERLEKDWRLRFW